MTRDVAGGPAIHPARILRSVAGLVALFAVSLLIGATAGFGLDETWFLQVVRRVVQGDQLYRDVFFLSTPLSVQLTAFGARLFGTELLVEKGVAALAFVAELGFASALLRACGIARESRWIAWCALFVYTQHFPNPPYRTLGSGLMVGAFWALVVWLNRVDSRQAPAVQWLAITGVLAGASFSSMPNHGLLALGSGATVIAVDAYMRGRSARAWMRATAALAGGFAVVASAFMAPVVASGAWTEFLDYTIRNKGPYIQAGGASLAAELRTLVVINPFDPAALSRLYRGFGVVLTPLAVFLTLAALIRVPRERKALAAAIALLVVSGVAGAYPRLNRFHLSYASPALIVGLVFGWQVLTARLGVPARAIRLGLALWVVPGVVLTLAGAFGALRSADHVWSSVPHFAGIRVTRAQEAEIQQQAARMRDVLGPAPLLIGTHASLYYLATGSRNPTPFDESSVMSFGVRGQQQAIDALSRGRAGPVCLEQLDGPLRPATLLAHITTSMRKGEDLGVCTVYR